MSDSIVTSRLDAWTNEAAPQDNNGDRARLQVSGTTDARQYAFIFFARPFPDDAPINMATLRLRLAGTGWTDENIVTVDAVTGPWKESGPGGIRWDTQPDVRGTSVDATVTDGAEQDILEIDVTDMITAVSSGIDWYGFRISVDTDGAKRFFSAEAYDKDFRPELEILWNLVPDAPTDLIPDGDQVVSLELPYLGWSFSDPQGDQQAKFHVQVNSADTGFGSPDLLDTGLVDSEKHELDLSTTAMDPMSNGDVAYWRVRVEDEGGIQSDWSEVASFERRTKGTLTITHPTSAHIHDTSPRVTHTFVDRVQKVVRYILDEWDEDTGEFENIYRSGRISTDDTVFHIPEGYIKGHDRDYRLIVHVWDQYDRVETPNDSRAAQDRVFFDYVRDDGPDAPDSLAEVGNTGDPEFVFQWHRATRPNFFAFQVDGVYKAPRLDPDELATDDDPDVYRYHMWDLAPGIAHTIEVEAVELVGDDYVNSPADSIEVTPNYKNKWLFSPHVPIKVAIIGPEDPDTVLGEEGETLFPIGRRDPVRITSTVRGYEGSVSGALTTYKNTTAEQYRDRLEKIAGWSNSLPIRLAWRNMNIRVVISTPSIKTTKAGWYLVEFDFWQIDDFTFRSMQ